MATYQLWIDDKWAEDLRVALDDLGQNGGRFEVVGQRPEYASGSLTAVPPRSMSVGPTDTIIALYETLLTDYVNLVSRMINAGGGMFRMSAFEIEAQTLWSRAHPAQPKQDLEARGEALARRFHELYEELAPQHGYETRKESAVPWDDVPAQNKALMTHVAMRIIEEGR